MLRLIPLALKVQIMLQRMLAPAVRARKHDIHVELAPALLVDAERRLLERLLVLLKRRVQVVRRLFEHGRHDLVARIVHQPDLDAPCAHGIAFHGRGLGAVRVLVGVEGGAGAREQAHAVEWKNVHGLLVRDELDPSLDLRGC
jgi:hypothetical protein